MSERSDCIILRDTGIVKASLMILFFFFFFNLLCHSFALLVFSSFAFSVSRFILLDGMLWNLLDPGLCACVHV